MIFLVIQSTETLEQVQDALLSKMLLVFSERSSFLAV